MVDENLTFNPFAANLSSKNQKLMTLGTITVGDKIKFPLPTQKVVLKSLQSR